MAATWKGFLSFGMISLPISLSPAARTERISFNQLHSVCHTRIKQPQWCPTCEKFVERSEIEKGYEYEAGQRLLFSKEELAEVDPVYFDSSYYAAPKEEGQLAYNLLIDAMRKTGYAALAKVTMSGREHIVIIRARDNGLTMHTMFYANEVRASEVSVPKKLQVKEAESKLAMQLIESLAAPFNPEEFKDAYQEALTNLIDAKAKGKKLTITPHAKPAPVIDLMEALKKSLNAPAAGKKTLIRAVPDLVEKKRGKKAA